MTVRLNQLRAFMTQNQLEAFLVTNRENCRYLSGFTGSSGALLITSETQYIVTDFRYFEQIEREVAGWVLWRQRMTLQEAVCGLLAQIKPHRLGFEADTMTVAQLQAYRKKGPKGMNWLATNQVVRDFRAIKDADEIEAIRQAQHITDEVAAYLPRLIEPGKTEKQVAWEVETLLRELGTNRPAFPIIVASGPNSSLPHFRRSDRVIRKNEMVVVDFGAVWNGYNSDMTRTYFTGKPSEEYKRIYMIVLEALDEAIQYIRAGMCSRSADAIARDVIIAHGYHEQFGHGLGHGIGLQVHESPAVSFRAEENETLAAGNVITIEPGIYIPGWGGVRIEDMGVITEVGLEVLTGTTKDIDVWRKGR